MNKYVEPIFNNCDNLETLKIVKDLINIVLNDIDLMNKESEEIAFDYMIDYDLGNNYYIKKEDLESLVSIIDTINDISNYNEDILKENERRFKNDKR